MVERLDSVATTTPRGLPAWGPRSAHGSVTSSSATFLGALAASDILPSALIA